MFSYLGWEYYRDCKNTMNEFGQVCKIINQNFKHKTWNDTRIKKYKT